MASNTLIISIDSPDPWASLEELKDFWQELKRLPAGRDRHAAMVEFRDVLEFRKKQGLPVFKPS
jgi:hypothetical protein